MLKYVFLFTLIANLNLCGRVLGQPTAYLVEVEHITIDDGILGRKVLDFYQDKRGIIWVITPEGLNRFDGRDFKWYKEFKAKDYYQYNQKICEDGEGLLWIFESQYLKMGYYPIQHLIHTYTDEVIDFEKKIKHLPFDWQDIVDIIQGKNGGIHFLTNKNRIYTYRSNNIFKRYLDTKVKITSLLGENEKGEIWAKHIDIHNNINLIKISPNGQSEIYNLKVPGLYFNFFKEKNSTDLFFDISNNESHFISISKNGKIKKFYFKEHKDIPDSILVNYSFPISHSKSSQNYDYLSTLFGFKIFSPTNEIAFDLDMIYPKENKYILDYGTTLFNNSNLLWVYSPDGIIKIHCNCSVRLGTS